MIAGSALVVKVHAVKLTGVTHQSFIRGGKLTTSNRPGPLRACGACGAYTFVECDFEKRTGRVRKFVGNSIRTLRYDFTCSFEPFFCFVQNSVCKESPVTWFGEGQQTTDRL